MQTDQSPSSVLVENIRAELTRLQLHSVNLNASPAADDQIRLSGSLLGFWEVPKVVDGKWFLKMLSGLPDEAGPEATMNAFCAAHTATISSRA